MNLEEYDFLIEMCLIALHMSKEVKFAAVIDNNGKLIAGRYRKEDHINNKRTKSRLLLSAAREKGDDHNNDNDDVSSSITFCHYNTNYLFYANYLTAAVKKIKTGIKYSDYREESVHHVELAEIHSILKIAITPLTANNDRYLCIYLESSSPNQEIIAKIGNTI
jgi:protein-arginine kinase